MSATKIEQQRRIQATDAELTEALADANVPALMMSLVHITGDIGLIRGAIAPDPSSFVDQQCGISEEKQADARALAVEILSNYRNAQTEAEASGTELPPVANPSTDEITEMIQWMIGAELPTSYTDFLVKELSMDGKDPYAVPALDNLDQKAKLDFHVVIIGAGMSGILAAHRLQQAGIPYTVLEKNAEVGGTWFENSYPGCRVDSPNHTYSYSFRPHAWPNFFSPRPVLRDYFNQCADEFGIRSNIRLNTQVESAMWNEASQRWSITAKTGTDQVLEIEANALISAVGQLNQPRLPNIDGIQNFSGPSFHSARWDHRVDLTNKRVGVIGTGASAFQFIPEIARSARSVTVFQRTPPWVRPTPEYHDRVPAGKHLLLDQVPYYSKWYRFLMFWLTAEGMLEAARIDPEWDNGGLSVSQANDDLRQLLLASLGEELADRPDLLAKCTPQYPPAGKRMLFDNGSWVQALKSESVALITDPIDRVTARGVSTSTEAGTEEHEFDVLIYGTGFTTSQMLSSFEIRGRSGQSLQDQWQDDPRAFLGITVPDFPNFFCLYGPNTNIVVNGSIIFFSECEVRYTLSCLAHLIDTGHTAMECRPERLRDYIDRIDEGNASMAWGAPHVRSWYKNEAGRVTQNWPFSLVEFWAQTERLVPADYTFTHQP